METTHLNFIEKNILQKLDIQVDRYERTCFTECEMLGYYILCEKLDLDTDNQEIEIYHGDSLITDCKVHEMVANYIYEHGIFILGEKTLN